MPRPASDHTDGRLQLRIDIGTFVGTAWQVRAGSGRNPGSQGSCTSNYGWLPNGTYTTKPIRDHKGNGHRANTGGTVKDPRNATGHVYNYTVKYHITRLYVVS